MITIPNFEKDFIGTKFKDMGAPNGTTWTIVGYGDNAGTPYLIGLGTDSVGRNLIRTFLFRDIEFVP